jgi:hypothetical protein
MSTALDITKQAYEAFGRRDIPAFLKLVADEVDWKLIGPASWPHTGLRRNPAEVGAFFADLNRFDDLTLFEPREFIEASRLKRSKSTIATGCMCPRCETAKLPAGVASAIRLHLTGICRKTRTPVKSFEKRRAKVGLQVAVKTDCELLFRIPG